MVKRFGGAFSCRPGCLHVGESDKIQPLGFAWVSHDVAICLQGLQKGMDSFVLFMKCVSAPAIF